jgi:membrane protein implicated in regulation of membrane protease activity
MNKLCCFVGATVVGYAGWFLADAIGWSFWAAFWLSSAGSLLGVYLGWKLARRLE